jgi:S-adenosylmethionine hydrolase
MISHEIGIRYLGAPCRLLQTAEYGQREPFLYRGDRALAQTNRSCSKQKLVIFVSPDNGSLTLISEQLGIAEIRQIDEAINRQQSSSSSYTFHGRDVWHSPLLDWRRDADRKVGKRLPDSVTMIPYQKAQIQNDTIRGMIPILDIQYGNVWTNIPDTMMKAIKYGDSLSCSITREGHLVFSGRIPLVKTFGEVPKGHIMCYFNSLMQFSIAINQGNFVDSFHIGTGPEWQIACWK